MLRPRLWGDVFDSRGGPKVFVMIDRREALSYLVVGDIFHATGAKDTKLICLVTAVTDTAIHARTMTTQLLLKVDRQTGKGQLKGVIATVPCAIDSITPLPVDIHNIMLGLDRKSRLEQNEERAKLTQDEIRALLFLDAHYESNQLPPI